MATPINSTGSALPPFLQGTMTMPSTTAPNISTLPITLNNGFTVSGPVLNGVPVGGGQYPYLSTSVTPTSLIATAASPQPFSGLGSTPGFTVGAAAMAPSGMQSLASLLGTQTPMSGTTSSPTVMMSSATTPQVSGPLSAATVNSLLGGQMLPTAMTGAPAQRIATPTNGALNLPQGGTMMTATPLQLPGATSTMTPQVRSATSLSGGNPLGALGSAPNPNTQSLFTGMLPATPQVRTVNNQIAQQPVGMQVQQSLQSGTGQQVDPALAALMQQIIQKLSAGSPITAGTLQTNTRMSTAVGPTDITKDPAQKQALDKSLAAIATTPAGLRLLQAAKAKNVTIEVGDPDAAIEGAQDRGERIINMHTVDPVTGEEASADDSGTLTNGVTLSNADGSNVRVVVRNPNLIKTIAHEMVHAVSTQDGNSREEEGIADVIGSAIANQLGGKTVGGLSGTDEAIYTAKQALYPELKQTNTIRQTLASLGLSVDV